MAFQKGHITWNKGIPRTVKERKKMREAALGKKHTEESKKKMSEAREGTNPYEWGAGFKKGNVPWNKNSTIDAYTAGIIDGEGYIGINGTKRVLKNDKERRYWRLAVRVTMKDREVPEFLQRNYGGFVYERKIEQGTYYEHVLQSELAEKMLKKIKPYLVIKKEQAEICIRFRDIQKSALKMDCYITDKDWEIRQELVDRLKSLHLAKGTGTND